MADSDDLAKGSDSIGGLSSEDLLRQTREELAGSTESALAAGSSLPETSVPPVPEVPSAPSAAVPPAPSVSPAPGVPPAPSAAVPPAPSVPPAPAAAMPSAAVPPAPGVPPAPSAAMPPPGVPADRVQAPTPAPPPNLGVGMPSNAQPLPVPPMKKPKRNIPLKPILIVGGLLIFGIIGWVGNRGKTSAGSLDLGDCFMIPADAEFENVVDQDCALPHEAQIYAKARPVGFSVDDACIEALIPLLDNYDLPDDISTASIEGEPNEDWLCVVTSTSGQLVGSVLPGS